MLFSDVLFHKVYNQERMGGTNCMKKREQFPEKGITATVCTAKIPEMLKALRTIFPPMNLEITSLF